MSTAVPGVAVNYTSISDARRRRAPDEMFTGQGNTRKTGRYKYATNMDGEQWVCLSSNITAPGYVPGKNFPTCDMFEVDWTDKDATAEAHGWGQAWSNEYSNRIAGSDGQSFGRPVTDEKVSMYISDIYRSLFAKYEGTETDWYDVPLRRYGIQRKDLENATTNAENAQYYQFAQMGLLNLTKAGGNVVSLWASRPHFLGSDDRLIASVSGLSPKKEIHDTFLDVEPNSGLLARAHKRLQLSYKMFNHTYTSMSDRAATHWQQLCGELETIGLQDGVCANNNEKMLQCMSEPADWRYYTAGSGEFQLDGLYFPTAYADEHVEMDEDTASALKDSLLSVYTFADGVFMWAPVIASLFFVALMVTLAWVEIREEDEASRYLPEPKSPINPLVEPLILD